MHRSKIQIFKIANFQNQLFSYKENFEIRLIYRELTTADDLIS